MKAPENYLAYGYVSGSSGEWLKLFTKSEIKDLIGTVAGDDYENLSLSDIQEIIFYPDNMNNYSQKYLYLAYTKNGGGVRKIDLKTKEVEDIPTGLTSCAAIKKTKSGSYYNGFCFYPTLTGLPSAYKTTETVRVRYDISYSYYPYEYIIHFYDGYIYSAYESSGDYINVPDATRVHFDDSKTYPLNNYVQPNLYGVKFNKTLYRGYKSPIEIREDAFLDRWEHYGDPLYFKIENQGNGTIFFQVRGRHKDTDELEYITFAVWDYMNGSYTFGVDEEGTPLYYSAYCQYNGSEEWTQHGTESLLTERGNLKINIPAGTTIDGVRLLIGDYIFAEAETDWSTEGSFPEATYVTHSTYSTYNDVCFAIGYGEEISFEMAFREPVDDAVTINDSARFEIEETEEDVTETMATESSSYVITRPNGTEEIEVNGENGIYPALSDDNKLVFTTSWKIGDLYFNADNAVDDGFDLNTDDWELTYLNSTLNIKGTNYVTPGSTAEYLERMGFLNFLVSPDYSVLDNINDVFGMYYLLVPEYAPSTFDEARFYLLGSNTYDVAPESFGTNHKIIDNGFLSIEYVAGGVIIHYYDESFHTYELPYIPSYYSVLNSLNKLMFFWRDGLPTHITRIQGYTRKNITITHDDNVLWATVSGVYETSVKSVHCFVQRVEETEEGYETRIYRIELDFLNEEIKKETFIRQGTGETLYGSNGY